MSIFVDESLVFSWRITRLSPIDRLNVWCTLVDLQICFDCEKPIGTAVILPYNVKYTCLHFENFAHVTQFIRFQFCKYSDYSIAYSRIELSTIFRLQQFFRVFYVCCLYTSCFDSLNTKLIKYKVIKYLT